MEKKEKMFTASGNWYKGNLHAHTTNSDGKLTPEQVVLIYKQHGYSFMCLSEHDYFTDLREKFDSEDFILLPGLEGSVCLLDSSCMDMDAAEYTDGKGYVDMTREELWGNFKKIGKLRMMKTHHIHGILGNAAMRKAAGDKCLKENEYTPVRVYFDTWDGKKAAQDLSDYLKSRGCFTTYNHPIWSRVDCEEVRDLKGIWAMEIYNYATVNECGEGEDTVFLDAMLRRDNAIMAFASDDNHNGGVYPESFGGYIMVQADALTHENIVNSMLEGRYYSSNGAEITQWGIKGDKVYVACPKGRRINFIFGGSIGSSRTVAAENGIPLTYVECPILGQETYVRIEVVDENEKCAWTNPVML
ncbi:MAG: PHP domain-containing protein [Lachnospiraceae bacterium]|nr:PHP domain-containing protein [Lachnospiraceae bacterium]